MKSDYKSRALKFIKQIAPYLEECYYETDYYRAVRTFNVEHHRRVECATGCVRAAFITSDYVIKIEYDSDAARRYGGCESEVNFYKFAKEHGHSYLFAEITPVEYNGRMYYIMPRISGIGRHENCYVQEFLNCDDADFVDEYLMDMHDMNYGWCNHYPVIIDYACNILTFPIGA